MNIWLDALLAADCPRLTHFETDDLIGFLGRAWGLGQGQGFLARLRTLGRLGVEAQRFDSYSYTSWEDTLAMAAALRAGVFPTPPAIISISYAPPPPSSSTSGQGMEAMGAVLAAVPAVTDLSLGFNVDDSARMGLVLQAMQSNHGVFQQLRCVLVLIEWTLTADSHILLLIPSSHEHTAP